MTHPESYTLITIIYVYARIEDRNQGANPHPRKGARYIIFGIRSENAAHFI